MRMTSGWIRGLLCVALMLGLVASPDALAGGKKGGGHPAGHPGGGARRAPRMAAPHRPNNGQAHHKAPQAARAAKAPARGNNAAVARSANVNGQARASGTLAHASAGRPGSVGTRAASLASVSPGTYHYGNGQNARRYQAQGYGRGYRNRYSGHSGYGRSQGNNRAIVSRLRSVHSGLARLDHDYRGHRVRAMAHLSTAIRQLSHRSMGSGRYGTSPGNNVLAMGGNRGNNNGAGNRRQVQHLSQAQSDSRIGQALRTTQGIALQMSHQGASTSGHSRAGGHVQMAMREMQTALNTR